MTICFVTNMYYAETGGIPYYYRTLSSLLAEAGHIAIVLTQGDRDSYETDKLSKKKEGVQVVTLNETYRKYYLKYRSYYRRGGYEVYDWIAIGKAAREWLKKNSHEYGIELVCVQDYGGMGAFLCDPGLPPIMIEGHSALVQLGRFNGEVSGEQLELLKKMELAAFRCADSIITHSYFNQADLRQYTDRPILFARAPLKINIQPLAEPSGEIIVISSLQQAKGSVFMAELLRELKKRNLSMTIHWYGSDTYTAPGGLKMSEWLAAHYADIWNQEFSWQGAVSPQAALQKMAEASLILIPSVWDTFNYCGPEAVLLQRPVVISQNAGCSYLFEKHSGVKVLPANDLKAWADFLSNQTAGSAFCKVPKPESAGFTTAYFSAHSIVSERIGMYELVLSARKNQPGKGVPDLSFLNKKHTLPRKIFFAIKYQMKKLLKRNRNEAFFCK